MNKRDLMKTVKENWYKYHIPGCSAIHRIKRNAIFISKANSLDHEKAKVEIAYMLQYFLTEAVNNKTGKRIDVVDLVTNTQYEIVCSHETHKEIKEYRDQGVIVFLPGKKFQCKSCSTYYPIRLKRHQIKKECDNCGIKNK